MKLILLRHGETRENRERIVQGQLPGQLTEKGHEQARRVGERLKNESIDLIYCSDLKRTRDTLDYIAPHHSVPVHFTKQIREKSFGEFEGIEGQRYLQAVEESGLTRVEYRPSGGESFIDLQERMWMFFNQILEKHFGQTVLACTHGGVIRALLAKLTDRSIQEFIATPIQNTSLSFVDASRSLPKVIIINDINHLPESEADTAV